MAVFPEIPEVKYEGPDSRNPLAFKHYNPEEVVGGKKMADHLRFAMAFWHTMNAGLTDPFGSATAERPWNGVSDEMEVARTKMRGIFELTSKLQMPYFCFHDRDIAPEGATLRETNKNLDEIVNLSGELQKDHPVGLLWGTANLFSNPRFMHGAASSPNAEVFAYAAAQVKKAIEVTNQLGGENYVFWGGREGYETLLNTDMKREVDNIARFMHMAVDYAKEIGFTGQFLFEPKPKEPTKHQYDFDAGTILGFLRGYDLIDHVKLNLETNHATLAGHTMQHELHVARINGVLGSVDANQGDLLLGWDTDQFPTDLYDSTLVMYEILKNDGLHSGGLNFDAHVRRPSFTVNDLAEAHIIGMDTYAKGLKAAHRLLEDGEMEALVAERYASWETGIGKTITDGKANFKSLEEYAIDKPAISNISGHQERFEAILNRAIFG